MVLERVWKGLLVVAALALVAALVLQTGLVTPPWGEESAEVRLLDGETGETLAVVDAEVADTASERYTGLSDHDDLEPDEGMLFVHRDEGERTYVMRDMDFGIDIVFVDADGEITTIHHAPEPGPDEDGGDQEYSGQAKWVLEVPLGYTNETDVDPGDELEIDVDE